MIPSLHYLLGGYRQLSTDRLHAAPLLELCRRHNLPYEDFRSTEDGGIALRFTLGTARELARLCTEWEIPLEQRGQGGLPFLLRRLLRRPGLWAGALLAVFLVTAAHSVIWDVRVTGNKTLSDRAVKETLAACGLEVGTPLRGLRADVIENQALLLDDRLAWLSVNRKGTVAHVEVREAVTPPREEADRPRDVVAARGGVIAYVELESGNVRVSAGQTVSEGELLVTGLYDSTQLGVRVESAKARVFARTAREFTVTIPLSYEQKRYLTDPHTTDSPICQEKSIIFFGNHIKFSKKTGNMGVFCDTIEDEISWGFVDGVGFPISTRTVWYLPYEITPATRTYAEAEELAYFALSRYIAAIEGATLLGKTVTVTHGEDALTLLCRLTLIEDIARERIIEVEE